MLYTIDLKDLPEFMGRYATAQKDAVLKAIQTTVMTTGLRLIQEEIAIAKPRPPVDTGTYRRGWQAAKIENGAELYNAVKYAGVIEHGRRQGARRPPAKALIPWVLRKGLVQKVMQEQAVKRANRPRRRRRKRAHTAVRKMQIAKGLAFVIARKIGEKGWPAPPYQPMKILEKASRRLISAVQKEATKAISSVRVT